MTSFAQIEFDPSSLTDANKMGIGVDSTVHKIPNPSKRRAFLAVHAYNSYYVPRERQRQVQRLQVVINKANEQLQINSDYRPKGYRISCVPVSDYQIFGETVMSLSEYIPHRRVKFGEFGLIRLLNDFSSWLRDKNGLGFSLGPMNARVARAIPLIRKKRFI